MTFLDFFAGIGGFRRGMELAGHKCVGFCEFDKFAVASYTSMHLITDEQREYLATLPMKQRQKEILKEEYRNGEWFADDIRRVDAGSLPSADVWCFGFPCQDISIAGKRKGLQGNRSGLFYRVVNLLGEIAEEKRPGWLFIENVKNLLGVNSGWDFARLLTELDAVGYDAEWQVLNSSDFGIPQNRERVFIIGHLRERSGQPVFPFEFVYESDKRIERRKLANTLKAKSAGYSSVTGIYPSIEGGGIAKVNGYHKVVTSQEKTDNGDCDMLIVPARLTRTLQAPHKVFRQKRWY